MRTAKINFIVPVYIALLVTMFVLPYYSAQGYSLLKHTTSHLGAQDSPNAWIMNAVFVLLGIACIAEACIGLKRYWVHKILLTIFGAGLAFVAVFQHKPIATDIPYSLVQDSMHSIFATIVGISFTLLAFSAAFIERTNTRRALALFAGLASIVFSVLMFGVVDFTGLWQRMMFIVSFAWLIIFLEGMKTGDTTQN